MQQPSEFFATFSIVQMLTSGLLLFPYGKKNQTVRLFVLLMLCSCGYILGDLAPNPTLYSALWWLESISGNALPGIFWLVSISVFSEHVVLQKWQYFVASLTLIIPTLATIFQLALDIQLTNFPTFNGLVKYGAMMLELTLIGHALFSAINQWRDDLMQDRRYIRGGVITFSGFYIIYVIVSEQLFQVHWQGVETLKYIMLSMMMIGINFLLFRLRETSLFSVIPAQKSQKGQKYSKLVATILKAMTEDKLYQQDGLTIAKMSSHLGIHEYRLRQLINGELQYRNFNDFLNFYRIKEVSEKLSDVELIQTPVLTLALESGFRSLSSFNKAFKDHHGVTPTAYRKKMTQQEKQLAN